MLRAISLYTGVGGLDFGLEAAGFRTAVAVEMDAVACRTLRFNRDWPVLEGDIHGITSAEILEVANLRPKEADILVGGPPCQPFSKSSYWISGDARRLDDPRSGTLEAYLRVLKDTLPRAFLLENVHGLAFKSKDEGLRYLLSGIQKINRETGSNYVVEWKVINAAHYGVPQLRERVFLVGSRDGVSFNFPNATHGPIDQITDNSDSREPFRTSWDAIGDLPAEPNDSTVSVGGKWADLLPTIPEGENYLWHTPRGGGEPLFGWRTRYWSFLLKLAKNKPSWTIQAQPGSAIGPFHWRNRKLTSAELCRLQTFPDGIKFDCGRTDIQKMLGNAVPSLVGEVLGLAIREQLLANAKSEHSISLLPPVRPFCPSPEPLAFVQEKYSSLIGNHADHPGEGKGVRALQNSQAVTGI